MKYYPLIRVLAIVITFCFAPLSKSWAELLEFDWRVDGDKAITLDTRTGLEWLDLTASVGRSYNYVSNNLYVGGEFECFKHATFDQVFSLLTSAGWPVTSSNGYHPDAYEPLSTLQAFLGVTDDRGGVRVSTGTTADIVYEVRDGLSLYVTTTSLAGLTVRGGGWDDSEAHETVGHWLVRGECIDEPFPWELFQPAIQLGSQRR